MSPENTLKLYVAFPKLYRRKEKNPQEAPEYWGFECDDGWFDLIWILSTQIENAARNERISPSSDWWPEALEVKAKFGMLRFYLRNASEATRVVIAKASEASAKICEICGAPGSRENNLRGDQKTVCPEHAMDSPNHRSRDRSPVWETMEGLSMPHKDKRSTLIRQWEMLRLLPKGSGGPWIKASDIASRLNDAGYDISVRTVQRDLKELSTIFPIDLNDKNPRDYGWRWMKGAHLDIPGLNTSEALAMRLVETHLKQLLPSSMLEALQGVFDQAKSRLEEVPIPSNWLTKVKVVQPNQTLLPPHIDEVAQNAIYKALLENRKILAKYRSFWGDGSTEYVLNPLGLIMRGSVVYLVATAWDYEDPRHYALHRFEGAEVLDEECTIPEGFDLEQVIKSGFADFTSSKGSLQLEFMCEDSIAGFLEETPLSEDQTINPSDEEWFKVCATVNDTWQLRWWLLSHGSGIKIISPASLQNEIAEELEAASRHYSLEEDENVMQATSVANERIKIITEKFGQRDPARIPVMLDAIREQWEKEPDMRLAQLIVGAISPTEPCPQVFYFEDDELLLKLK